MNRAPRVLALLGDETGCSLWRVWQPFAELEKRGFVAEWAHKDKADVVLPLVAAGRYDAIITPRIVWPHKDIGERWINIIHKAGLAWLYEVDDDVFSPMIIPRQSRLFETEAAKGYAQLDWERQERIRLLSVCDGVTVTTQRLATVVKAHAGDNPPPVYVIPNSIDARWFKETLRGCDRIPELKGKLTVGWAGGAREQIDVAALSEAWSIIAERYPEVQFVIQGFIPGKLYDSISAERRHSLPWLQLPEYPRAWLNIDIACCVVAPMGFNHSKSCIKWYEATLGGAVSVVSPTVYGREATDGHDALIAETTEELVVAISRLIESEELRKTLQRNARKTVMTEHSLENNWWRWPDAWEDAIERFRNKPQLILSKTA